MKREERLEQGGLFSLCVRACSNKFGPVGSSSTTLPNPAAHSRGSEEESPFYWQWVLCNTIQTEGYLVLTLTSTV